MNKRRDALVSGVGGALAIATSFAVAGKTPAFVGAGTDRLVTGLVPGVVMGTAIDYLGEGADILAFGTALVLAFALFSGVTYGAIVATRRSEVPFTGIIAAVAGGWLLATVLTVVVVDALYVGGAMGLVLAGANYWWGIGRNGPGRAAKVGRTGEEGSESPSPSRRSVVAAVLGVAGLSGVAYLHGRKKVGAVEGPISDVTDDATQADAEQALGSADRQSFAVTGLGGLVTPADDFYQVDKNAVDPNPSAGLWSLRVTGAVDEELELSYDEITGMKTEHRFATLRCVGESVNGEKMDTALWSGVPIQRLLDRAGIPDGCCVMLHADDGYYEEFSVAALRDGFLAFGMNGRLLPRSHGYPVRALIPGHWGEINVKWVTEIEVLDESAEGFWEKKGWHGTGPVETVAKLHAVNHLDSGAVQVAGHAYAGTRGIRTVEVSTDGGETWQNADLGPKLPGPDVWRQWKFQWKPQGGKHEVIVRAVDGTGTVQPEDFRSAYPNGPTGWVSRTISV